MNTKPCTCISKTILSNTLLFNLENYFFLLGKYLVLEITTTKSHYEAFTE